MSVALITRQKSQPIAGQHQALESQARTILIFDYIAYTVTEKYVSLMGNPPTKK
jgi:hypothetical protein